MQSGNFTPESTLLILLTDGWCDVC